METYGQSHLKRNKGSHDLERKTYQLFEEWVNKMCFTFEKKEHESGTTIAHIFKGFSKFAANLSGRLA